MKLFSIVNSNVPNQHRFSVQETVLEFCFQRSTVLFSSYTKEKKHLSYNTFVLKHILYSFNVLPKQLELQGLREYTQVKLSGNSKNINF